MFLRVIAGIESKLKQTIALVNIRKCYQGYILTKGLLNIITFVIG